MNKSEFRNTVVTKMSNFNLYSKFIVQIVITSIVSIAGIIMIFMDKTERGATFWLGINFLTTSAVTWLNTEKLKTDSENKAKYKAILGPLSQANGGTQLDIQSLINNIGQSHPDISPDIIKIIINSVAGGDNSLPIDFGGAPKVLTGVTNVIKEVLNSQDPTDISVDIEKLNNEL